MDKYGIQNLYYKSDKIFRSYWAKAINGIPGLYDNNIGFDVEIVRTTYVFKFKIIFNLIKEGSSRSSGRGLLP